MSNVRSWAKTFLFAPLVLLSFSYAAYGAGSYAQSFDSDPPFGWTESTDAWSATNGFYANVSSEQFRAIAYFSDRRWTTDFVYSLQMNSDLRGTGNHKVGVVFNFVDDMNYYEVAINMLGDVAGSQNVELNRVSGGQRTQLLTRHSDIPILDTWFDVAIIRIGANRVKVRIGNKDVLDHAGLTSPPAGYIGVLTQFNRGRFDDVKVTPTVFHSGFGAGLSLTPEDCDGLTYWQRDLTGAEDATGTEWPPTFWGTPEIVLMNTILACSRPFESALEVKLFTPPGESSRVLSNKVTNLTPNPDGKVPRLGLSYTVGAEGDVPNRFYVRRYLKYSSALANPGNDFWFMQHEFKNMSCNDPEPPRRLTLGLLTTPTGEPFYRIRMDQENTLCDVEHSTWAVPGFADQICYPRRAGAKCPDFTQTTGQWFYDEYFVQYSTAGTTVAYAINGKEIFNYSSAIGSTKARGIKLTPGYVDIPNVEVQVDDLEIFHDAPCRVFPCGAPSHY